MPGLTPLPTPDTAPYWEGAAAGSLVLSNRRP